jgi:hypothetical protein
MRLLRNDDLAAEHLLHGVEGFHEFADFDDAAFVDAQKFGDEQHE